MAYGIRHNDYRAVAFDCADQGKSYFANRSGANLLSGITTEFVVNSTLSGRCRKEYAVIECDEAASVAVFPQLKPRVIVVTNLFRDQLDRYGEVSHTLANVQNLLPLAKVGKRVYLYDKKEVLTILRNGEMTFPEGKGVFSVFAIGKASGVSVSGALYPLSNAELSEDFPLGVSNEFVGKKTVVSVKDGTIIVTFPLHTDLPK